MEPFRTAPFLISKLSLMLVKQDQKQICRERKRIMDQQTREEFLTVSEVASLLRVGKTTVYEICRYNHDFPAIRVGRQVRVLKSELLDWLKTNRHCS